MAHNRYPFLLMLFVVLNFSCLGQSSVSSGGDKIRTQTTVKGNTIKWHPGHYYTLVGGGVYAEDYLQDVYAELDTTPALQGLQVRNSWRTLEPEKDKYDFSSIDKLLAGLAPRNKRMVILFSLKSFSPNIKSSPVPDYIISDEYGGGLQRYTGWGANTLKGHVIKLWNAKTYERFILLLKKLGERYNSNPYFEGIGFTETVFTPLEEPGSDFPGMDIFHEHILKLNKDLKSFLPNTLTYQFTNYPRSFLGDLTTTLKSIGAGFGGPDIFLTDIGLHTKTPSKGAYHYYPELSGIIPLMPSVQHQNYRNTQKDDKGFKPTLQQLLSFGRDTLKANYLFWTRDDQFYKQVLVLLNQPEQKSRPAGGLQTACPSVYQDCYTQ